MTFYRISVKIVLPEKNQISILDCDIYEYICPNILNFNKYEINKQGENNKFLPTMIYVFIDHFTKDNFSMKINTFEVN